jgi:hypothetical protein
MSYSNTPNTGDTLGSTKVPINTNFSLIQAAMSQNHYGMGTGASTAGKHKIIHIVEQATEGQTLATETAIYNKSGGTGDLFIRSPNHVDVLPNGEYQLTTFNDANITRFGNNLPIVGSENNGWTFLPGGLLMQFGRFSAAPVGITTVNLLIPYTFANFQPIINISFINATGYIDSLPLTATMSTFDIKITNIFDIAGTIFWTAIGKP